MSAKAVWKAVRVGRVEEDHERGSARTEARRGSEESAGRESIMEARKAAGAREVASGREIPPAVAGWSSWKAVSSTVSERRVSGRRRRTAAMARTAEALAEAANEAAASGEEVVMVGGVRRKWWLKEVWGRRQSVMMSTEPWTWTPGMEVKWVRRAWYVSDSSARKARRPSGVPTGPPARR